MEKQQSDIIAKELMREIMYDNGMVNRWNPEVYPKKCVDSISVAAGIFFEKNPDVLTNEHINNICCGEYTENQEKYGILEGYSELDEALNKYFNGE